MDNLLRRIGILLIVSIAIIIGLAFGMFYTDINNYEVITQTDELTGQRIGVTSGGEADYFLSTQDDVTLKRYDTIGDPFLD